MNILIFEKPDFISSDTFVVSGQRARHIIEILRAEIGDTIKIGELNGNIGVGEIVEFSSSSLRTRETSPVIPAFAGMTRKKTGMTDTPTSATCDRPCETVTIKILDLATPSLQPHADLILALPRPQMLKRILENVASLGVRNIYLIKSEKVEKSFFSSPVLNDENIKKHLLLGLEQSATTILPRVKIYKNFKQFVGELSGDDFSADRYAVKFIAHNKTDADDLRNVVNVVNIQQQSKQNSIIAIGPEGGWTENEVQIFIDKGFQCISLGNRILRVETAVYVALWKCNF